MLSSNYLSTNDLIICRKYHEFKTGVRRKPVDLSQMIKATDNVYNHKLISCAAIKADEMSKGSLLRSFKFIF